MDTLMTLNFLGYAAVFAGGAVLGTLFGRNLASELASLVHSLESRVTALETALHLSGASEKTATSAGYAGRQVACGGDREAGRRNRGPRGAEIGGKLDRQWR